MADFNPEIENLISLKEDVYQLPRGFLKGIVYTESRGNPRAYNRQTGASGLTKIISRYHPGAGDNLFDPENNLDYAAKTLKRYAENFGSYKAAAAAWHSGETRVQKSLASGGDGIPGTKDSITGLSTRDYVSGVLAFVDPSANDVDVAVVTGEALQNRPFNRASLGILGLGLVFLGALVLAVRN
jgi:soluble lytic murein transglycosylase-like protein